MIPVETPSQLRAPQFIDHLAGEVALERAIGIRRLQIRDFLRLRHAVD
jgi:hypothetical protein